MFTLGINQSVGRGRVARMENKDRYRRPYAHLWIVAGIFVFIGYVLHVVGFATSHWTDFGSLENLGLWTGCSVLKGCVNLGTNTVDWFRAVQALTIIGITLGSLAVLSLIICNPRYYKWRIVACLCAIFAGLSVIVAVAVYGGETRYNLGYSYGLSVAGGGLMLIGGIVLCVDMCINRGYRREPGQVRNPPTERPHYESNYIQELRAPPYDAYTKAYPVQEPPRVYERYLDNPYDRPQHGYRYEPYDRKYRYDRGDRSDRYDTPQKNYGRYDPGRTTYVAYKPEYERNTGRYDYY